MKFGVLKKITAGIVCAGIVLTPVTALAEEVQTESDVVSEEDETTEYEEETSSDSATIDCTIGDIAFTLTGDSLTKDYTLNLVSETAEDFEEDFPEAFSVGTPEVYTLSIVDEEGVDFPDALTLECTNSSNWRLYILSDDGEELIESGTQRTVYSGDIIAVVKSEKNVLKADSKLTVSFGYYDDSGNWVEFPDSVMSSPKNISYKGTAYFIVWAEDIDINHDGKIDYLSDSYETITSGMINSDIENHLMVFPDKSVASGTYRIVYKKVPNASTGGDSIKQLENVEIPEPTVGTDIPEVSFSKSINKTAENYKQVTLSESSTRGDFKQTVPINVIVVLDTSGSMTTEMTDGSTRMTAVTTALKNVLADSFNNNVISKAVIIPFSTEAAEQSGWNYLSSASDTNNLSFTADGTTNWEDALMQADTIQDFTQDDESTAVIFITDGNPTARNSRVETAEEYPYKYPGDSGVPDHSDNGTYIPHYNGARFIDDLKLVDTTGDSKKDHIYFGNGYYTLYTGTRDNPDYSVDYNYRAALPFAKSIVNSNKHLFGMGIGTKTNVGALTQFMDDAGANTDDVYLANDEAGMESALSNMIAAMKASYGYTNVTMHDSLPEYTDSDAKRIAADSTLSDADKAEQIAIAFTYTKRGSSDTSETTGTVIKDDDTWMIDWDGDGAGDCAAAEITTNADGTADISWNPCTTGKVAEDGTTYNLKYNVWPSQSAYDTAEDFDNKTKTYSDTYKSAQLNNKADSTSDYTTDTNTALKDSDGSGHAYITYQTAYKEVGSNDVSGTFDTVYKNFVDTNDTLNIKTMPIQFNKTWDMTKYPDVKPFSVSIKAASTDKDEDGKIIESPAMTVTSTKLTSDTTYLSPGQMTTIDGTMTVLDSGHDYTLSEDTVDDDDKGMLDYFDTEGFDITYHPMVIDEVPTMLVKAKDGEDLTGKTTYTINGSTYYVSSTDATPTISVKNTVNSEPMTLPENITLPNTGGNGADTKAIAATLMIASLGILIISLKSQRHYISH